MIMVIVVLKTSRQSAQEKPTRACHSAEKVCRSARAILGSRQAKSKSFP